MRTIKPEVLMRAMQKADRERPKLVVSNDTIIGVVGVTGKRYDMHVGGGHVECSCPGFAHYGVCYHAAWAAMVLGWLREEHYQAIKAHVARRKEAAR